MHIFSLSLRSLMISRYFLLAASILMLAATLACGGDNGNDNDGSGGSRTIFTDADLTEILLDSGYSRFGGQTDTRTDDGIVLSLTGPETVWVKAPGFFHASIANPEAGEDETAFDVTHTEGSVLLTGPVEHVGTEWRLSSEHLLSDGDLESGGLNLKCNDVGSATVTVQSTGITVRDGQQVGYSNSAVLQFECVDTPPPAGGINPLFVDGGALESYFDELTDHYVGESSGSVTWVTFEQDGVVLRVNQIEPATLQVGQSADLYSDYVATKAWRSDIGGLEDARIEFSGGGPVRVEDLHGRSPDPVYIDHGSDEYTEPLLWGYAVGRVTCLEVGEGVYSANLIATQWHGADLQQIVSGVIDCIADPNGNSSGVEDGSGDSSSGQGEITDVTSPTEIPFISSWSGLTANRKATGDTYNLGTGEVEVPYWHRQFRVEKPHPGCDVEHIHAEHTVYAWENWSRGSSGWKTNEDLPLEDPDPEGCGFGQEDELNGKTVAVEGQDFIELCIKLETTGIGADTRRQCDITIDSITD